MAHLEWIADKDLEDEVNKILFAANTGILKATSKFDNNVIDPFSIIFEMAGFGIDSVNQWEINEKSRKAQKTLSNSFGTFHQGVLGHVKGWMDLGTGKSADILCEERKIIAEVKNKFNTVKGSDQVAVFNHLESLIMPIVSKYHGYTAYYVEIVPRPKSKKPQVYDIAFTPSDSKTKTKKAANPKIRKIDGRSIYELVTGDPNALIDLYNVLPVVIQKISGELFEKAEVIAMQDYFNKAFVK